MVIGRVRLRPSAGSSIALSSAGGIGRMQVMSEQDPELQKKAQRAQWILYGVMIFFLVLPFVLLWLKNRGVFGHF